MRAIDRVMASLGEHGLLLRQDKSLPSVVTLIAGEAVAGSWWGHAKSGEVFRCLSDLQLQSDMLESKLIGGKVTYVHRRLWPALLAVAGGGEAWQTHGLSQGARTLLANVQKAGSLIASGTFAKELETRLLVHGNQVHTESGHHETRLESWDHWSQRTGCAAGKSVDDGRAELEAVVIALGGSVRQLPWSQKRLRSNTATRVAGGLARRLHEEDRSAID
jgi:hypothetical protein